MCSTGLKSEEQNDYGSPDCEIIEEEDCGPQFFDDFEDCQRLIYELSDLLQVPADKDTLSSIAAEKSELEVFKKRLLPSVNEDPHGPASKVEKLEKLLSNYQEQPHLLHPYLEQLMHPLLDAVLRYLPSATDIWTWELQQASEAPVQPDGDDAFVISSRLGQDFSHFDADAPKEPLHLLSRALYAIVKTAGEKASTSYFSNDVKHFEDVFYVLRWWVLSPRRRREWEVRYCLLLWLGNLVLVPFSMELIDTNASKPQEASLSSNPTAATVSSASDSMPLTLSESILVLAISFLQDATKCRDGGALLVARLLTRPDSDAHRKAFFALASDVVKGVPSSERTETFLWQGLLGSLAKDKLSPTASNGCKDEISTRFLPGILMAVAKTMKLALRDEVKPHAPALATHLVECVWDPMLNDLNRRGGVGGNTQVMKLSVKVIQRLMLSMLPNRGATWKYHKTTVVSLAENLGITQTIVDSGRCDEEAEEAIQTPEENHVLELGIGLLLEGLGHKDTVVRWSAAKGIGRVCDRIPASMADDVISAVLSLFEEEIDVNVWHGAMMALAELCRRGCITDNRLSECVPLVEKGLRFDIPKGTYSVGEQVRDAAAYTCWSIARAYDPDHLQPHAERLSGALVVTAVLDRQVNVRRAASAAFQECVGRLGNFPHGIEISTTIDFYALASRHSAYTVIAPKIAHLEVYREKLIKELVEVKLIHWDRSLRISAAESLGRVAQLAVPYVVQTVLPKLLESVTANIVATRHGALLGIAALVRYLPPEVWGPRGDDPTKPHANVAAIVDVFPRLDTARLFRSRGGEYVREAGCKLLEALAFHRIPLPEMLEVTKISGVKSKAKTLGKLQEFYEDSWSNILDWLQLTATESFRSFALAYYTTFMPVFHEKMLKKMTSSVLDDSLTVLQRKGGLAALGGIPTPLLLSRSPARQASSDGSTPSSVENSPFYFVSIIKILCPLVAPPGEMVRGTESWISCDDLRGEPECRRNAVVSLMQTILSVPADYLSVEEVENEGLVRIFFETIILGLRDYATDNRGDVGSIVRLAVLEHIAPVLFHCLEAGGESMVPQHQANTLGVLQALLRLLFEKLDRVREGAGKALEVLVASSEPRRRSPYTLWAPESEVGLQVRLLHDVLAGRGDISSDLPSIMVVLAPPLLRYGQACWGWAVADGLVVSAGDVGEHVRVPAIKALRSAFSPIDSNKWAGIASYFSNVEANDEVRERLSQLFTSVSERHEHEERIICPLSKALEDLLNQHLLSPSAHISVVKFLKEELRFFSTNLRILLPLISLLGSLCRSSSTEARSQALGLALTMIASRYPKARAVMATELFTALTALYAASETEGAQPLAFDCQAVLNHISKNRWDGTDGAAIRAARDELYGMLNIDPPARLNATASTVDNVKRPKREIVASSYSALVKEAGY